MREYEMKDWVAKRICKELRYQVEYLEKLIETKCQAVCLHNYVMVDVIEPFERFKKGEHTIWYEDKFVVEYRCTRCEKAYVSEELTPEEEKFVKSHKEGSPE